MHVAHLSYQVATIQVYLCFHEGIIIPLEVLNLSTFFDVCVGYS